MKIEVVEYREEWPELFDLEKKALESTLDCSFFELFHIGSTSVPGLAAKPIIDSLLVVEELFDLDDNAKQFEKLGYEVCGEFGIKGRRYYRKGGELRTHQIHAFSYDNLYEIGRHLAVRDYLRNDPETAKKYGAIKKQGAQLAGNDIDKYGDFKEAFVKELEAKAIKWQWQTKANASY